MKISFEIRKEPQESTDHVYNRVRDAFAPTSNDRKLLTENPPNSFSFDNIMAGKAHFAIVPKDDQTILIAGTVELKTIIPKLDNRLSGIIILVFTVLIFFFPDPLDQLSTGLHLLLIFLWMMLAIRVFLAVSMYLSLPKRIQRVCNYLQGTNFQRQ